VELFSQPAVASALAFRGGTVLYKLHFRPAARYSEDIDLVQTSAMPIGPVLDAIHGALDHWLGKPQWKQTDGRVTLGYRFDSEDLPPTRLKLKIEINSREHFTVFGVRPQRFEVSSRWFSGSAELPTYELDELLGTKLRALYQRKKGRDLFDLAHALQRGGVSADRLVEAFERYMDEEGAEPRGEEDRPDVHRRHGAAAGQRYVVDLRRGLRHRVARPRRTAARGALEGVAQPVARPPSPPMALGGCSNGSSRPSAITIAGDHSPS
jgi:predicted nucleotidyltransferase component of viral defense system